MQKQGKQTVKTYMDRITLIHFLRDLFENIPPAGLEKYMPGLITILLTEMQSLSQNEKGFLRLFSMGKSMLLQALSMSLTSNAKLTC